MTLINKGLEFKRFVFCLFVFYTANFAHAEGYELPLYNPDLMTFFSSESRYALSNTIEYPEDIFQFGSGGWFDDIEGNKVLEAATGFIFPVNEHISIPLYFSVLSNSPSMMYFPIFWPIDPAYFEMFTGSGLIVHTKWLTLGTYVGYHGLTLEETETGVSSKSHGINYAIVPIIKTDIGYLKKIENYFSTGKIDFQNSDSGEKKSWDFKDIQFYTKFVIDGFNFLNQNRNSIEPYYSRANYDWKTKNNIYGLRLGINHLVLEGGYRVFDEHYDNGFFIAGQWRFKTPETIRNMFDNEECFVSFSIDENYKRFGIGIADVFSQNGGNGLLMLEAVLNKENDFSISFTEKLYINWSEFK